MMLSIFSCACWPFLYFLWEMSIQILYPLLFIYFCQFEFNRNYTKRVMPHYCTHQLACSVSSGHFLQKKKHWPPQTLQERPVLSQTTSGLNLRSGVLSTAIVKERFCSQGCTLPPRPYNGPVLTSAYGNILCSSGHQAWWYHCQVSRQLGTLPRFVSGLESLN